MPSIRWTSQAKGHGRASSADALQAFKQFGGKSIRALAKYPSPPSHSTYRRTGTLGRNWTQKFSKDGGDWVVEVQNATPYASFVQGEDQVRVHKSSGWSTLDAVVDDVWPGVEAALQAALNAAIDDLAG